MIEPVIESFLLVVAAEMGDKTQLLAFILVARFKKPWAIMAGILAATLLNHFLAAFLGVWISQWMSSEILKWILGLTFLFFALWILKPDNDDGLFSMQRSGAFLTTFITFFLAEMGDKTQLATVALAAKNENVGLVTFGTTLGMLLADGLAVFLGEKITSFIPMKWIHRGSAILFMAFGVLILLGVLKVSR